MHIDFALPVNGSLSAGLTEWRRKAAIAVMDYGFHMAVTSWDAQVSLSMLSLTTCSYICMPGRLRGRVYECHPWHDLVV